MHNAHQYDGSPDSSVYIDESDCSNFTNDTFNSTKSSLRNKKNGRKPVKQEEKKKKLTVKDPNTNQTFKYNFVGQIKEDHHMNLYNVQVYRPYEINQEKIIFVTVGGCRCSFYEYVPSSGSLELVDAYTDADKEEIYYTCAWSTDPQTHDPICSIAGVKGIIRTIVPFKTMYKKALIGHGGAIHDLRYHPSKDTILLSSSQDYTLRLWNIQTSVCIAIIGGVEGHRDEVLSGDFNLSATLIMSSSIDHSLKMWNINTPKVRKAIEDSETFTNINKSFPTVLINHVEFTTRDVHSNYIDYVRWLGDLVLSKSCQDCVVCWKPGLLDESLESVTRTNKNVSILHTFDTKDCDIWYVRFGLDFSQKYLAMGTQIGKIYLWDLETDDHKKINPMIISNQKSKTAIRSVALTMNGQDLIAVNDEGFIFVWKKNKNI